MSDWPAPWSELEQRLLMLTNANRETGACCGEQQCSSNVVRLESSLPLQLAARRHAKDMADRDYFGHDSPDGSTAFDRIREAGFTGCAMGENITAGPSDAEFAFLALMDSSTHCANNMWKGFRYVGLGYYSAPNSAFIHYWVQAFGN